MIHVHLLPLPDARDDDEVHDDAEDGQAHVQDDHKAALLMRCQVFKVVTGHIGEAVAAEVDLQFEKICHFIHKNLQTLVLKLFRCILYKDRVVTVTLESAHPLLSLLVSIRVSKRLLHTWFQ